MIGLTPSRRFSLLLLALALAPASAHAGDRAAGAQQYKQKCQMCHTVKPGQKSATGPNLFGVTTRSAGQAAFVYSTAMKNSKLKWDGATLTKFLAAPNKVVPGTRMVIKVADAKQRDDIVAYLLTLK